MRVKNLQGYDTTWPVTQYAVSGNDTRPRSAPHLRCRALLSNMWPCDQIYEEVPVPGTRCLLDFIVPARRVVVEVQGRQHFVFNPFMHKTKANFVRSLRRDADKVKFCDMNGLTLVALSDSEDDDEWKNQLKGL